MEPKLDLTKEYGLVLEGGGAKGAYQIGAWRALKEAGVKIRGVSGTSVGALNGALICMDDLEKAEKLWANISYSQVMDVDDALMRRLFDKSQMTSPGTSRPTPVWPPASPPASPSPPTTWSGWRGRRPPSTPWGSGTSGCGCSTAWPGSRCRRGR